MPSERVLAAAEARHARCGRCGVGGAVCGDGCVCGVGQAGPMLVVSWLLQCVMSWELWQALPSILNNDAFCLVPFSIQCAASMVHLSPPHSDTATPLLLRSPARPLL